MKRFNFKKKIAKLTNAKSRIPELIAGIALRHFQRSFRDQGFTDETLTAWQKRKSKDRSDRNNPTKVRAILVKSGNLKNSGRIRVANWKRVVVGFYGVTYGKYHNRGEGHNPKRQYIGRSKKLAADVTKEINYQIKSVMK